MTPCWARWASGRGWSTVTASSTARRRAYSPPPYQSAACQASACADTAQADAWHAAGLANGGTSIEDPPGVREGGMGKLYLAYLRDPDGNKICALHRMG